MGFFEKAGLDVKLTPIPNGNTTAAAVANDSVDIGSSNLVSLEVGVKKGLPLTLIAPATVYDTNAPGTVLVVARDSPLRTPKDLEGKLIATSPLRGIGEYAIDAWIDRSGGDAAKVTFVEIPMPEMAAALGSGRIAAAFMVEPYVSQAKAATRVFGKPYDAIGRQVLTTGWITSVAWAKAHPDLVARFAAVMRRTAVWANANHPRSGEILARISGVDAKVIAQMSRARYGESLDASQVQPTIDLAARYKLIDAPFPATQLIFAAK
jgi:NitT/TauT family transport system substrate-binding protein